MHLFEGAAFSEKSHMHKNFVTDHDTIVFHLYSM